VSAAKGRTDDRGFATIEFVVLFPIVLFSLVALVQLALWGHMRATATAAAQDAAAQLAVRHETDDKLLMTETIAAHRLQRLESLRTRSVGRGTVDGVADSVEVTIDGELPAILPMFSLPIHAKATATIERFRD
jgi:Flp pilus assembly protein TadG